MVKKINKQMEMDPNTPDAVKEFALGKAAAETGEGVVPLQPENNTVAAKAEAFDTVQQQNAGVAPGNQQAVDVTGQPGATAGINGNQGVAPGNVEVPGVAKVTDPTAPGQKNVYLYDWASGMSMADAYKQGKHNRGDIMRDRERWGRENNSPVNVLEAMDMVPENHDPRKTYQENELEEKRRKREENWEKIGNFLSHLGNFVGAVGWGGSVQGLETPQELTKRQQMVRDKTEALRSAYNKSFFENYYKQRADEINQQKQKLAQRQQDRLDAQQYLNERKFELDEKIKNGTLDLKKLEYELKQKVTEGKLTHQAAQDALAMAKHGLAVARENRLASGTVTETTKNDKYGKPETVTRVVRPGNSSGTGKKKLPGATGKKRLPGQQ